MMLHDITHCAGGLCPRKELCYRYLAGIEAQKSGMIVSWISPLYGENRCVYFMEVNN